MANDIVHGTCLGCGADLPASFLDLGLTPLANAYVPGEDPTAGEPRFPLAVACCAVCHLVQLVERVAPETLFDTYLYFSSFSDSFLEHAREMSNDLIARFGIDRDSRVLEVASNDGYLLQYFRARHIPILGVEPAQNLVEAARRRGIPTLARYFGTAVVPEILSSFGPSDLVIGNNVLAHVPAINDFLNAVRSCLTPMGVAVFEVPYLGELLRNVEFDTIYHEHVFYFSLSALEILARRAGLELLDVQRQTVHGGSLRVFMQMPGARRVDDGVGRLLGQEEESGFLTDAPYAGFGRRVAEIRRRLTELLSGLKGDGHRLAAYGAPAKGNTLLNYCGIDRRSLDFTVDRSPYKQGLRLPGSRIPIRAPAVLLEEMPDFTLILPWNLAAEIISQQKRYLQAGGKFIVAIPEPRIIDTPAAAN